MFPRVLEVADSFDCYRIAQFWFRILPAVSSATGLHAAGFYPGITDGAPASINDVSENVYSVVKGINQTVPTQWCKVPRQVLQGYVPWYKTVAGSIDAALERVGTMFYFESAGGIGPVQMEFKGVFEFKGSANTGATPAARQRRMLLEEKNRMLKILALSETDEKPARTPGDAKSGFKQKKFTAVQLQDRAKARQGDPTLPNIVGYDEDSD